MSCRTPSCMPAPESAPHVIVIDDDSQKPDENTPTMLESFGLTRCVSVIEAPRKRSRSEEEEEEGEIPQPASADTLTNLKPKRLVYDDTEDDEPVALTQASPVAADAPTVTATAAELEEGEIPSSSA
jgi:hypothetical protein